MRLMLAAALTAGLTASSAAALAAPQQPTLIPREVFFGNPERTQAKVSPDGRWLSWVAPRDGVLNVWVAPASDPKAAKPLTQEKNRPIPQYFWAPDSSMILYVNDAGGEENFHLYGADVATGVVRDLTPFENTRVNVWGIVRHVTDKILVGLNNRDPKWHDLYSLDLKSGKLTLVLQNDGFADFTADGTLTPRMASKPRDDGGTDFYRIEGGKPAAEPFASIGLEDSQTTLPAGFSDDGKTLYWIDSRDRDTAALTAQDWATGKVTVLGQDARADIGDYMTDPKTGRIDAYSVNYLTETWKGLNGRTQADLAWLADRLHATPQVTSRSDDDSVWVLSADPVTAPTAFYKFDRKTRTLTKLFVTRPQLEGAPLAPMHPIEIRSRDGLVQVSYLTLPPGSDADGDGVPEKAVPLVLMPHGGPWGRNNYGFSPRTQWLANRGYAVLSPNFRASAGFGKKFISAGDLEWGRKMQDDLDDAVDWAVKQGVTTPDKVAIYGGSYGGYAVLAGMTFTPDRYACGIDEYGISNMETLLSTLPPYWESLKAQFYRRMGDPTTEAGRALLKERSPLWKAGDIKAPLLIGQGANDPRVRPAESEQIVAAMTAKNIPVTYLMFPDEGHGWRRPENNIAFTAAAENFLQPCLGGRAEPMGEAIRASSMQVIQGQGHVPGLAAAK
ncbi:S9 family peptidase [Caulobacter sp. 17J65-9]|uniref:S9 family peptidase n=1 Tax=Caulobacter sp. 17J65-9 TaxID=2709382 RepID=UPI0013C7631F|nr:S9 family peptidase [Caulobacter sp. 17J65-9]NEX92436.1 S9 family peptidase [Caulobacter sp. 17J65-9]